MLALVKPLLPAVEDFLAHSFWQTRHVATVHFENGKYHLHADLKEAAPEEDKSAKQRSVKGEENNTSHLRGAMETIPLVIAGSKYVSIVTVDRIPPSIYISIPSLPPWFS
ncbi:MAG: hypothetical protein FD123_2584 [Bacteroidetes bacterium]|nr:MAG: hypothetical protein FD123_2584 [Bacteroidota bacterium]